MTTEYRPATYANILDQMLARGLTPGHGGHLEGTEADVSRALARLQASCFSFSAAEVAQNLGMDKAQPIVRDAVRGIGRYRGNEMRLEVERRGLPLDVAHMLDYWDYSGGSGVVGTDFHRSPHYCSHDVLGCSYADQLRRLCPKPLAVLMCEEVHLAVAREFNPAIDVWYPAILTRGQAKCIFRFSMPMEAAERAAVKAQERSDAARDAGHPLQGEREAVETDAAAAYRGLARLHVIFYHHVANELLRALGEDQTEDILRRAMRKWGAWRGEVMAADHRKRGWALNLETFITYSDDPAAGDAWVAENVILTPSEHTKDVSLSPYSTWLDKLGTGRFALALFEEALPAQAQAYSPAISLTIPELMERGDSVSRFCYKMGS